MAETEKKTVLITRANKGIGFEIARQLITRHSDWTIWIVARSRTKGLGAIEQLNNKNVHLLELDGTSDDLSKAAANPLVLYSHSGFRKASDKKTTQIEYQYSQYADGMARSIKRCVICAG
jgi:nucleoside-diphosphate-sugar epimerase